MAFKHKVTQELDKRGIKTKFFCELHNIKVTSFYQTISGVRPDRKCIKTLYKKVCLSQRCFRSTWCETFPQWKGISLL